MRRKELPAGKLTVASVNNGSRSDRRRLALIRSRERGVIERATGSRRPLPADDGDEMHSPQRTFKSR